MLSDKMGTRRRSTMPTTHELLSLPSFDELVSTAVRLLLAALLGGLLGHERESMGKPAGLRTHTLVALGSAVLALLITQNGSADDLSRVIQGVAAGIGFIGAGTILKQVNSGEVVGLTTAANIWLTAAVGLSAGAGRLYLPIVTTLLALIVLQVLPRPEGPVAEKGREPNGPRARRDSEQSDDAA
jgi:putative Mg2+ transporter-C (MgtC) family protein